jgi:peptidoglycan/LPS O-acetylase OafA/YrhL
LWSISVEEQFYLFVPGVVKFVTRKVLCVFCVFFVLLSNVSLFYLVGISAKDEMIWANSLVQFECFATGVFLCLVLHGRVPSFPIWQRFILFVMGWACWFFSILELDTLDVLGRCTSWALMEGYALASLGSMLMLLAFLGVDAKFLPGWAIYLGRISFGLYVFHFFAMFITGKFLIGHFTAIRYPLLVLKGIIVLGLTILMAMLSYRYLETPFLKMKKRHAVIESQPILSD